jgi:WD40 repeat protein
MDCPRCHGPMTPGNKTWMCGECDQHLPLDSTFDARPVHLPALDRLPSILALSLHELAGEGHPVVRVHRMCDAVEILTRFATMIALGELRRRLGEKPFPKSFITKLRANAIWGPTFGQWKNLLLDTIECLKSGDPLVVPELLDFVRRDLMSVLTGEVRASGAESNQRRRLAEHNLIRLRNDLVHGGPIPQAEARRLLEIWLPKLDALVARLDFLKQIALCHLAGGMAWQLAGPAAARGSQCPISESLADKVRDLGGHMLLLRGNRWVDLWPLCDYGKPSVTSVEGTRQALAAGPLVYYRDERDRLLYTALGVDLPWSEQSDAIVLTQFHDFFKLESVASQPAGHLPDCELEMRTLASAFKGRTDILKQAKATVKATMSGVLWLTGPPGIGKSCLAAKLALDLPNAKAKDVWRIYWRFKASDDARGNRVAFLRSAVEQLARKLGQTDVTPAQEARDLKAQLIELLKATVEHLIEAIGRPPRMLFVLDGLDEIARSDPRFPSEVLSYDQEKLPNVVWICTGRPEGDLPDIYQRSDRCRPVFEGGLPPMSENDVRVLLLDGTGRLRSELVREDKEPAGNLDRKAVTNKVIRDVTQRAAGLPLYVTLVIKDINEGHFKIEELRADRLPPSLDDYYDDLIKRMSIGSLRALLTPLLVTIAWAREPLDEETLLTLMVRLKAMKDNEKGRVLLRQGLSAIASMIRLSPTTGRGLGYEPCHHTFRTYIRENRKELDLHNEIVPDELCAFVLDWQELPIEHSARTYALRHGPSTLIEFGRWESLEKLLLDPKRGVFFLAAKVEAGMVYDLAADFAAALRAIPSDRPARRILQLLARSIGINIDSIARHPSMLFQCLWNTGWWYDASGTDSYYDRSTSVTGSRPSGGGELSRLLEAWRRVFEDRIPRTLWLRSLRPPPKKSLMDGAIAEFREHDDWVTSVAFDRDGTRIVSGSRDRTVRVCKTDTQELLLALPGHKQGVTSVAFSPDGKSIVSGSEDGNVRIWDSANGDPLRVLPGHHGWVNSVAFSPDGKFLVSGSTDGTVRVWDADSGELRHEMKGHNQSVTGVAFGRDGNGIVSGSEDGTIRIWDADSGKLRRELPGHEGAVTSVAFGRDGNGIVSGSEDGRIRIWDADTGNPLHVLGEHECGVSAVGFSPDGKRIVSGSQDGRIRLWDVDSGKSLPGPAGHEDRVTSVAFSPDGKCIVSGSRDETVRLWDAENPATPPGLTGHEERITNLTFSPDGRRVASASEDCTVRLWDAEKGTPLAPFTGHNDRVNCVAFSPDGSLLASASDDQTVKVWDVLSGRVLATPEMKHKKWVRCVAFSPDGRWIASGSSDRTVRIWNADSGEPVISLPAHDAGDYREVDSVAFSPDGGHVAAAYRDQVVRIWDTTTGTCERVIPGSGDDAAVAAGWATEHEGRSWRAIAGDRETLIEPARGGEAVAWFPAILENLVEHPSGRIWAGSSGKQIGSWKQFGGWLFSARSGSVLLS